jgi:hypothetical protein
VGVGGGVDRRQAGGQRRPSGAGGATRPLLRQPPLMEGRSAQEGGDDGTGKELPVVVYASCVRCWWWLWVGWNGMDKCRVRKKWNDRWDLLCRGCNKMKFGGESLRDLEI